MVGILKSPSIAKVIQSYYILMSDLNNNFVLYLFITKYYVNDLNLIQFKKGNSILLIFVLMSTG